MPKRIFDDAFEWFNNTLDLLIGVLIALMLALLVAMMIVVVSSGNPVELPVGSEVEHITGVKAKYVRATSAGAKVVYTDSIGVVHNQVWSKEEIKLKGENDEN